MNNTDKEYTTYQHTQNNTTPNISRDSMAPFGKIYEEK
jgi:hypothetical protein